MSKRRRRGSKPWTVQPLSGLSGLVPVSYVIVHPDGSQHTITVRPDEPGLLDPIRDPRTGKLP